MLNFINAGRIHMAAVTTMGVSVKEGDTPIGKFGTGLKYTIAGVLRLGGEITIQVGDDVYTFDSAREVIRGKEFNIVRMAKFPFDPIPLGFTTDLGKHWEPWMYLRELWSNARDEGGRMTSATVNCGPNETCITVLCSQVEEAAANISKYILEDFSSCDEETVWGHIYPAMADNVLFYRGIRVGQAPLPMLRTYNLMKELTLTEDRTIAHWYNVPTHIRNIIANSEDAELIGEVMRNKDFLEYKSFVESAPTGRTSEVFDSTVKSIWKSRPHQIPDRLRDWAETKWEDEAPSRTRKASEIEMKKLRKACAALTRIGIEITPEEVNIDVRTTGDLLGFAKSGKIFLTERALSEGVGTIFTTLLEEYIHAHDDIYDYTRSMQDRLLRIICNLYEEHVSGEPL